MKYIQASAVFQLQAQENSKSREAKPQLTSGPTALTNGLPEASLSVETMTLKGHRWEADEYSIEILSWDLL